MIDHDSPAVGYMNPPENTRFKKGRSGNPLGRPRKPKDINTILHQVLKRKVRIRDEERKIPISDALILKLRELALQGDKQCLALQRQIIKQADLAHANTFDPEAQKEVILKALENMGVTVIRDER